MSDTNFIIRNRPLFGARVCPKYQSFYGEHRHFSNIFDIEVENQRNKSITYHQKPISIAMFFFMPYTHAKSQKNRKYASDSPPIHKLIEFVLSALEYNGLVKNSKYVTHVDARKFYSNYPRTLMSIRILEDDELSEADFIALDTMEVIL